MFLSMVAGARVRLLLPDPPARKIFTDRWGFVSKDSETRTIADGPESDLHAKMG
jgi:hypothetical protein